MSTVHEITKLQHPTTTGRSVYSPLEAYWKVFRVWRKRRRLQTELCGLTDHELMDIGITRGEIDYVTSSPPIPGDVIAPDVSCWGLNRPKSAAPEGRLLTRNGHHASQSN
jgi:uncharacterized protein YjiS (DUF1127 family)